MAGPQKTEHPVYKIKGRSVSSGRYIRATASTHQGVWIASKNSIDDTIHIDFAGQKPVAAAAVNETDLVALREAIDQYLAEDATAWTRKMGNETE